MLSLSTGLVATIVFLLVGVSPALLLAPAGPAFMLLLSGASGVAFGGPNEPLPSPMSSVQGAEIREFALRAREQHGGQIVIHSGFERASTWPMRDSGSVIYASRIPAEATVVIWPVTEAAPEGFAVIEGQWSWEVTRHLSLIHISEPTRPY